jgi:hypothetical protein
VTDNFFGVVLVVLVSLSLLVLFCCQNNFDAWHGLSVIDNLFVLLVVVSAS